MISYVIHLTIMHSCDHHGVLPHGAPVVGGGGGPLEVSEALALAHTVPESGENKIKVCVISITVLAEIIYLQ